MDGALAFHRKMAIAVAFPNMNIHPAVLFKAKTSQEILDRKVQEFGDALFLFRVEINPPLPPAAGSADLALKTGQGFLLKRGQGLFFFLFSGHGFLPDGTT